MLEACHRRFFTEVGSLDFPFSKLGFLWMSSKLKAILQKRMTVEA